MEPCTTRNDRKEQKSRGVREILFVVSGGTCDFFFPRRCPVWQKWLARLSSPTGVLYRLCFGLFLIESVILRFLFRKYFIERVPAGFPRFVYVGRWRVGLPPHGESLVEGGGA